MRTRRIELTLVGVLAVVVGFVMLRHEMWRDELQAWLIAKAASTPHELLHDTRYEGHPFLWYALLWPFAHVSHWTRVEQAIEWVLAVAAAAVVVLRAPFTRIQKALYVLGYFVAFEYGVLARSYTLGMLLVLGAVAVATAARPRWSAAGVLLGLAAFTSAFGAIVAPAIGAGLLVDAWSRGRDRRAIAGAAGIGVVVLAVAYLQARPAAGTGVLAGWHTGVDAHRAAGSIALVQRALLPIPKVQHAFWNTSLTDGHTAVGAVLGVACACAVAWAVRRSRAALVTWVVGVVGLVGFSYLKLDELSTMRYVGHAFVLLVAVVWLAGGLRARASHALTALLVLHAVVGVYAVVRDTTDRFSDAKAAAAFLRTHYSSHTTIVAEPDFAGSPITAFLDRPLHYANGDRDGTFVLWDSRRQHVAPVPHGVVFVSNTPRAGVGRLVASFTDGMVPDEHYWIYATP